MLRFLNTIRGIFSVINFMSLPKKKRRITFYSEGVKYWPHLEGLVRTLLATNVSPICYISSSPDDPGLMLENANYHKFYVGTGFILNWIFQNIDTDFMIMTTPDLHQYQVKRSHYPVHYIYVQHSLVSLHMAYRKGAFDHFDTICCSGPHHVKEIRAMEVKYELPAKNIFEHGYSRLDTITQQDQEKYGTKKNISNTKHILIAPSWGPNGLIESGLAKQLIEDLLKQSYYVTLRPHPQTIKHAASNVDKIIALYEEHSLFSYEDNVSNNDSFHYSDIMISDWSGAALEYAFGLQKPIIFCDIPKKANNPDYLSIDLVPLEVSIRNKIGVVWNRKNPISDCIERCDSIKINLNKEVTSQYVFNLGDSDRQFVENFINNIYKESSFP